MRVPFFSLLSETNRPLLFEGRKKNTAKPSENIPNEPKLTPILKADTVTPVKDSKNTVKPYILVLDHGTTGIRACLMDGEGAFVAKGYKQFKQIKPKPGWVEHNANTLWKTTLNVIDKAFEESGIGWNQVQAIAMTNQRETTVLWDSKTGKPIHNAIVWQCRRTTDFCEDLKKQPGAAEEIQDKTGLVIDPYFSASKIRWLLDNVPKAKDLLKQGRLRFGTVDSWILWNLSGGKMHVTDKTNASRTELYNIHTKQWDPELLARFGVPAEILPKVAESNEVYGNSDPSLTGSESVPLAGCAGDQQAALFGQKCWEAGTAKSTFGTGAFLVMNLGDTSIKSKKGLLTTLVCNREGQSAFGLEGSIFNAGTILEWLKNMGVLKTPKDVDKLAGSLDSNEDVYFVPALSGLGAPYWDPKATGMIDGLTLRTGPAQVTRAAVESIAYMTREVLDAMQAESGKKLSALRVDGGVTRSNFFMQFLSDILGIPVIRTDESELTAKGAGYLAGLATGFWKSPDEIQRLTERQQVFEPKLPEEKRQALFQKWLQTVKKVLTPAPQ